MLKLDHFQCGAYFGDESPQARLGFDDVHDRVASSSLCLAFDTKTKDLEGPQGLGSDPCATLLSNLGALTVALSEFFLIGKHHLARCTIKESILAAVRARGGARRMARKGPVHE